MGEWKKYHFKINGLSVQAEYNTDTVKNVFIPLLQELTALYHREGRRILVLLAAPPAVGKSTLSQFLEHLSCTTAGMARIQALGMDGFHYHADYIAGHEILVDGKNIPMQQVKGCPETFDTEKLQRKLAGIRQGNILWPIYDRGIHDVIEDATRVTGEIILLEGNYLLLDEAPWKDFKDYADYRIMIRAEEKLLYERLVERKIQGGLTREDAERFYRKSDSVNVRRVLKHSGNGDLNLMMQADNDYSVIL